MMKDKKINVSMLGFVCSIVQIIISVICLIYNYLNHDNYTIWIVFLCSGICLLFSNPIMGNKETDNSENARDEVA